MSLRVVANMFLRCRTDHETGDKDENWPRFRKTASSVAACQLGLDFGKRA